MKCCFLKIGVSRLCTLHTVSYRFGNTPSYLPHLPPTHQLTHPLKEAINMEVMTAFPSSWVIQDVVSPGLNLLTSWLEVTGKQPSSFDLAFTASNKLAVLLEQNWNYLVGFVTF